MKFSIITVTYNSEKHLDDTLRSVREQSFRDYEHIIWDGGSTDRTLEIVAKSPNVKLYQGSDQGISDAMNLGASKARGDFILHLHSDDRLSGPESLEKVADFLQQQPESLWMYGQLNIIDEDGNAVRTMPFVPFDGSRLRKYNIISHPATFVSRDLFHLVKGFQTRFRYCMDYDLWLRLAQKTDARAMPFVVSEFREHTGSLSTNEPLAVADEAYEVRNLYTRNLWERYRSYRTWRRRRNNALRKLN